MAKNEISVHEQAANKCRKRINDALRGASVAFYDMSMGLLEAYENEYAREWGFENFSDYVQQELDMKYRTAYYMVEIGRVIRSLGLDKNRVQKIGWTKLKEVSCALMEKPEDAEKYLSMAESMSSRELRDAMQSEVKVTEARESKAAIMRMSLKFEGDEAGVLSDGLAMAYADIGKEDVNLALTHIVGEWIMARGGTESAATLEDWLAYIKRVYGVNLVRAEAEESLDALLVEATDVTAEAPVIEGELTDDDALNELLR